LAERIAQSFAAWRRAAAWIGCCVILLGCLRGVARDGVSDERSNASEDQGPFSLDLERRSLSQAIGPEVLEPQAKRFVEIEIVEVFNPDRIRIAFEVHYQGENGEKVLLGTFGLFPPDRRGRFIVATRGRLRSGGVIILSLQVLDKVGPEDEVRVRVGPIGLRER
jgi:hypothetical protein